MQENILEHTTSITGLTCKPLAILSETISPQEMSRVRGGNHHIEELPGGGPQPGQDPAEAKSEERFWQRARWNYSCRSQSRRKPKAATWLRPLGSPSPTYGSNYRRRR